jgi:CO dehydrogenase maturation factor
MRIAFLGKGGSGKTTIASLFLRYLDSQNISCIGIDADINQHLAESLGMDPNEASQIPNLGNEVKLIKEYIRGENLLIESATRMAKTTPPGRGSKFLKLSEENEIFKYFCRKANGISIMATGSFTSEDMGVSCYHSKTGAVELILNHLLDTKDEYFIIDMTAGSDSFASGLFTRFDLSILVVEPNKKSIDVYKQYIHYAKSYGVNIAVVDNKIENKEDIEYIKSQIEHEIIAIIGTSDFIKRQDRHGCIDFSELDEKTKNELKKIYLHSQGIERDWKKQYEDIIYFHKRNAESWANAQYGFDMTNQIDKEFSFENMLQK